MMVIVVMVVVVVVVGLGVHNEGLSMVEHTLNHTGQEG